MDNFSFTIAPSTTRTSLSLRLAKADLALALAEHNEKQFSACAETLDRIIARLMEALTSIKTHEQQ